MLRLLLLRHSKAAPFTGSGDHQRPLIARGRADAARLGAFIADEKITPQLSVHSGSRRTGETLQIVLAKLKHDTPVSIEPRLYEASDPAFLSVLHRAPDAAKTLLVVGHNPSLGEAACQLAGTGERPALLKMAAKFPTSGLAVLDFDTENWREIAAGAGRLMQFVTPASLRGED